MMEDDTLLAAAVGPAWDTYYQDRFDRMETEGPMQWNWAAALVPFWAAWRKLPFSGVLYAAEYFLVAFAAFAFQSFAGSPFTGAMLGLLVTSLLAGIVQGKWGTWWVRANARRRVRHAQKRTDDLDAVRADLARDAPQRSGGSDLVHALSSLVFIAIALFAAMMVIGHQR